MKAKSSYGGFAGYPLAGQRNIHFSVMTDVIYKTSIVIESGRLPVVCGSTAKNFPITSVISINQPKGLVQRAAFSIADLFDTVAVNVSSEKHTEPKIRGYSGLLHVNCRKERRIISDNTEGLWV